jgi:hypothetical protein
MAMLNLSRSSTIVAVLFIFLMLIAALPCGTAGFCSCLGCYNGLEKALASEDDRWLVK